MKHKFIKTLVLTLVVIMVLTSVNTSFADTADYFLRSETQKQVSEFYSHPMTNSFDNYIQGHWFLTEGGPFLASSDRKGPIPERAWASYEDAAEYHEISFSDGPYSYNNCALRITISTKNERERVDEYIEVLDKMLAAGDIPTTIPVWLSYVQPFFETGGYDGVAPDNGEVYWNNGHPYALPVGKHGLQEATIACCAGRVVRLEDIPNGIELYDRGMFTGTAPDDEVAYYMSILDEYDLTLHPELRKDDSLRGKVPAEKPTAEGEKTGERLSENVSGVKIKEAPANTASYFDDVSTKGWSYSYVQTSAYNSYISGYGDGKFGPTDTLTVEQYIKILLAAIDPDSVGGTIDCTASSWAMPYVAAANNAKVVGGREVKLVDGLSIKDYTAPLDRYGMAVLTANATKYIELTPTGEAKSFTDVDAKYADAVATCSALGILDGVGNGEFDGASTLTREQAAKVIVALMRLASK